MKNIILSSIVVMGLFIGCGSNDSSSNNDENEQTVDGAKKQMKALSSLESLNIGRLSSFGTSSSSSSSTSTAFQKVRSQNCPNGGSMEVDDETFEISYNNCKSPTGILNGNMSVTGNPESENFTMHFSNFTYVGVEGSYNIDLTMKNQKNGSETTMTMNGKVDSKDKEGKVNNIKFTNLSMVEYESSSESWSTIDGKMDIVSPCFSGTYNIETIEKLVEVSSENDNLESGVLKLNGATYTFANPYVTIKAGSEERTITQEELDKEMSNTTECS